MESLGRDCMAGPAAPAGPDRLAVPEARAGPAARRRPADRTLPCCPADAGQPDATQQERTEAHLVPLGSLGPGSARWARRSYLNNDLRQVVGWFEESKRLGCLPR